MNIIKILKIIFAVVGTLLEQAERPKGFVATKKDREQNKEMAAELRKLADEIEEAAE